MSKEDEEISDKDLEKLAEKLDQIQQRRKKEEEQNDKKEENKPAGYAMCNHCHRILTKPEYDSPNCPHCGTTKATIIQW